jgi:predicted metalloprotease with PDZ domain
MKIVKPLTFGLLLLAAMNTAAIAQPRLGFDVTMAHPETHRFHVVFHGTGLAGSILDFKMPVWMPGYYQILDYAGKVENFHATDGAGHPLACEQISGNTWRVAHAGNSVMTVDYDVLADKAFVANPWLDSTRAYINGPGVFFYPDGYLHQPVTVTVHPWSGWHATSERTLIATGLRRVAGEQHTFIAADFDILYDSPILVGSLEAIPAFTVKGVPHYFVGYYLGEFDRHQLSDDLKKVVTVATTIIGDIPYTDYTFLALGPGRGGIEHLNSTTVGFSGEGLSKEQGREKILDFLSHEYFHHYNVKRIRPIALGPFDYERENRTNMLWVAEGLTVYYEYKMVHSAALMSNEAYLKNFQNNIAAYEKSPGHLCQTLAQASYETWSDGPFGRTGDSINKTISYYEKGPAVGLLLDMAIRHATANQRSLDDVMRRLYREFYQQKKRGFTDDEFSQVCESIAGQPLPEIFDYVFTVKEPDYAKYLGYGGMGIDPDTYRIYPLPAADETQLAIRKSWLGE